MKIVEAVVIINRVSSSSRFICLKIKIKKEQRCKRCIKSLNLFCLEETDVEIIKYKTNMAIVMLQ